MQLSPTREEFLAADEGLVALSTEINIDLDTPVSIYYKLVGEDKGFIMESVDTTHHAFGRFSFIGAEPLSRIEVYKSRLMIEEGGRMRCIEGAPVESIQAYLSRYRKACSALDIPLAGGGIAGYLNFEIVSTFDRVRGMEVGEEDLLGEFMLCRVLVAFDTRMNRMQLIYLADTTGLSHGEREVCYARILVKLEALRKKLLAPLRLPEEVTLPRRERVDFLGKYGKTPHEFLDAIAKAKEHIYAGDIFQVVPSRPFRVEITKPGFQFYRRLRQVNPSPYMFYFNFGAIKLVGASPEMLVKVAGETVFTYPIAGTRKRGASEAEDAALARELKGDEKECAEHAMLVDLARNDIGRISKPGTVQVTKLEEIEYFSHVMHMVSEVEGKLREDVRPMDVLAATFPAGTVSGAPKLRAMEIIGELESVPRGTYAGTVGYMDFSGNMDMCITLRTMRIENDREAVVQSGAGIVADSVAENEYREILQKSKALFQVVEEVENDDPVA